MFRNILLGLDFSDAADRALAEAIALAERHGGRLTILTAIPEVRGWAAGPIESVTAANQLNEQLIEDACALQHHALERVPDDLPVATVIRRASARRALLEQLRTGGGCCAGGGCHDSLVLGASRHGRLRCSRSLTRYLLRRSEVPVLVVGAEGAAPRLHLPRESGAEATPPRPPRGDAAPQPGLG